MGGGVRAVGGKPPLPTPPPPLHRARCLPCPSWADSQAGSWKSARCALRPKDGHCPVGRGRAAGREWEKSGCRLLGSCAQTVCLRHGSWLSSRASPAGAGKGPFPVWPWPCRLSYCTWRLILRGIWDLPLARHVAGPGAGLGVGRKMGEPRLSLQPG